MFKFLGFVLICCLLYFAGIGFLRTAARMGWSESGEVKPVSVAPRR